MSQTPDQTKLSREEELEWVLESIYEFVIGSETNENQYQCYDFEEESEDMMYGTVYCLGSIEADLNTIKYFAREILAITNDERIRKRIEIILDAVRDAKKNTAKTEKLIREYIDP